jgi:hypothetical protein
VAAAHDLDGDWVIDDLDACFRAKAFVEVRGCSEVHHQDGLMYRARPDGRRPCAAHSALWSTGGQAGRNTARPEPTCGAAGAALAAGADTAAGAAAAAVRICSRRACGWLPLVMCSWRAPAAWSAASSLGGAVNVASATAATPRRVAGPGTP